ncbi:TRAP transporter permease [Nocardioides limicola]|uniref:TRAP transporter permease n=1 Tax=Nocardioides limicola TaxID=2803368 RepID=UPI00193BD731|nr:TRAP transporter fused permease subunit [Nocardioides sp. DJM-14]
MSETRQDPADHPDHPAYDPDQAARDIRNMTEADPITAVVGPVRTELHVFWRVVVWVLGLSMSLFHLYTAWFGTLPSIEQRGTHLAFGLAMIFLIYNSKRNEEKEKVRGLYWTAGGLVVLLYLWSSTNMGLEMVAPAMGILVLLQMTRYVRFEVGGLPLPDLVLAVLGVFSCWWVASNASEFNDMLIRGFTPTALAVATTGTLLVLAAATRAVGLALTVVCAAMIAYALFGRDMPGFLFHGGMNPNRVVQDAFLGTTGIFGIPISVSATFIFVFMIFAALLQRTGMERFLTNLALGIAGGRIGGTAKVGVITSVFSGTITGSSVANTVSNGAFTIPMMKRSGYKKEFAGAVEAASSTGGQICPPVMGAAAFIMLQTIGGEMVFADIIRAALIPALLFFTAQFIIVHYVSKREGITGLPKEHLPKVLPLLVNRGYLVLPLILIFVILSIGMTPMRAAMWAVITTVLLNIVVQIVYLLLWGVEGWRRMPDKLTPKVLADALVEAARMSLPIVAATAAAGMISGTINNTGLGLKVGDGLIRLGGTLSNLIPFADTQLYFVMFFTMLACLILGMGLPTTANYVVMAVVAAPAIVGIINGTYTDLGLPEKVAGTGAAWEYVLIAHMFVFYFGVLADITPPVCLASFAAAGISGGNPLKTGVQSIRIAISGFIVPYAFVVSPGLLLLGNQPTKIVPVILTALAGIIMLGIAVAGFATVKLGWLERLGLTLAALMMLHGTLASDLIGLAVGGVILGLQFFRRGTPATPAAATA